MPSIDYRQIQAELFEFISPRSQDVLARRFGLGRPHRDTLDAIGRDLLITRERVRQIEEASLSKLRSVQTPRVKDLRRAFCSYLEEYGGLRREDMILDNLSSDQKERPYVLFFLALAPDFFSTKADELVYPFWATDEKKIKLAHEVIESLVSEIESRHRPLLEDEIYDICPLEKALVKSCLEIARKIEQGIDGSYGLADWPEVCPQRLKDKAYLVLKETAQPLHFTRVAEIINEFNARWQQSGCRNTRQALSQTVHNELIRDPRFVLVGRGLYALKEWGYESGTVKDLIIRILKESNRPMTRDEIVDQVLKQRMVEKTTVLFNLGRKDHFRQNPNKTYSLVKD